MASWLLMKAAYFLGISSWPFSHYFDSSLVGATYIDPTRLPVSILGATDHIYKTLATSVHEYITLTYFKT